MDAYSHHRRGYEHERDTNLAHKLLYTMYGMNQTDTICGRLYMYLYRGARVLSAEPSHIWVDEIDAFLPHILVYENIGAMARRLKRSSCLY